MCILVVKPFVLTGYNARPRGENIYRLRTDQVFSGDACGDKLRVWRAFQRTARIHPARILFDIITAGVIADIARHVDAPVTPVLIKRNAPEIHVVMR